MTSFSASGQKRLKICHIIFAGTWLSSACTLGLINWLVSAPDAVQMLGVHETAKFIDDFILIPAANGTWVTGLLYSLKTRWGFSRYRWVLAKWAVALSGIVLGTFVLGPALNALPAVARELRADAFSDPRYLSSRTILLCLAPFQVGTLVLACSLSVLKPWGDRRNRRAAVESQARAAHEEATV